MDSEFNMKIELVAKSLNLQGEYVWNSSRSEKSFLHLSCDIEGHLGKDNRYYLVDTARFTFIQLSVHFLCRLLPPSTPKPGVKGSFLINQLRPELVKSNQIPLCSGFLIHNCLL